MPAPRTVHFDPPVASHLQVDNHHAEASGCMPDSQHLAAIPAVNRFVLVCDVSVTNRPAFPEYAGHDAASRLFSSIHD